jgi:phenylacetate-CoA ligase
MRGSAAAWEAAVDTIPRLPIYRHLYGARAQEFAFGELATFPLLERDELVRHFPHGWTTDALTAALQEERVEYAASSGTSGERVQLVRPKDWWLGEHRRGYRHVPALKDWVVGEERNAVLTTMDCSAAICFADNPRYEDRAIGSTLYLNTTHDPNQWSRRDVERMLRELIAFAPKVLEADPVFLSLLLHKRDRFGIKTPIHRPEVLKLTYELATHAARRVIRRHLDVPTVVLHGTTELGWLYHETEAGFQRCPELSVVELLPFCPERGTYELVVTSVKNELMPFVRFRLRDVVRLRPGGPGEESLVVDSFCGRARDAVPDASGGLVTPGELDDVLARVSSDILIYQARLSGGRRLTFRYVTETEAALSPEVEGDVRDALASVFGDVELRLVVERQISPERSGKFMILGPEAAPP